MNDAYFEDILNAIQRAGALKELLENFQVSVGVSDNHPLTEKEEFVLDQAVDILREYRKRLYKEAGEKG